MCNVECPVNLEKLRQLPGLTPEGVTVAEQAKDVQDFYSRLKAEGLLQDAIQILPHRMTRQQAVWWGCLSIWKYLREGARPDDPLHEALKAAIAWVQEPGEPTRRQAETAGKAAGMGTPMGCLALAAAWSEGSLAPPDLPPVPPPADLTARLAAGATLLAAVQNEPQRLKQAYLQILTLGEEALQGQNHWTVEAS